jgi:hypothetical protein
MSKFFKLASLVTCLLVAGIAGANYFLLKRHVLCELTEKPFYFLLTPNSSIMYS